MELCEVFRDLLVTEPAGDPDLEVFRETPVSEADEGLGDREEPDDDAGLGERDFRLIRLSTFSATGSSTFTSSTFASSSTLVCSSGVVSSSTLVCSSASSSASSSLLLLLMFVVTSAGALSSETDWYSFI